MEQTPFFEQKEETRRETREKSAGTRRDQEIMMEQAPFFEQREKRQEGRPAPEPESEPRRTRKS